MEEQTEDMLMMEPPSGTSGASVCRDPMVSLHPMVSKGHLAHPKHAPDVDIEA
jgi:hypothetical protein